jgi:phosphatidylserine/phosphatidylglycerophosphate/cardiolipin synthase-like enzyme
MHRRAVLALALPVLLPWPAVLHAEKLPAEVSVCFVPGEPCGAEIVDAIAAARREVRVQAYGFSAPPILEALAAARARGVDVAVILDRSDERRLCDRASELLAAGVKVWIDRLPGIAHNKIIVIDRRIVIGGSYNYTASAERRNAENVTFIESAPVAQKFLDNWATRQAASALSGGAVAGGACW